MNYRILLVTSLLLLATGCGSDATGGSAADAATADAQPADTLADAVADTVADTAGADASDAGTDGGGLPDVPGGDVVAPLYTTCVAVSDCVAEACKIYSKDCEKPCLAAASAAAVSKAALLLGCIQSQCSLGLCKDATDTSCTDDCLGQKCGLPLTACVDDGKAGATQCGDALSCFDTCKIASGKPISCIATCYNALDAGGKKALGGLLTCFQDKGNPEACSGDLVQCLVSGKTGDKGCYTFFDCQQSCGNPDDFQCIASCAGQMTAAAQKSLIDAIPCFGQEQTPVCQGKVLACIAPTGVDSCVQTFDCVGKCPQGAPGQDPGPGCAFECLHGGKVETVGLFTELTPCGDPASDKAKCADGFLKCANPAGTKTCGQITACAQACGGGGAGCLLKCLAEGSTASTADWKAAYVCTQACGKQCQADSDPQACENTCNASQCLTQIKKCTPPQ